MKNTLKKGFCSAIAFIMAFIMTFGSSPAFATEIGDTVKWYNEDGTDYHDCIITDKIDAEEVISIEGKSGTCYYYYIFNVEKAGYYVISQTGYPGISVAKDFENGVAHGTFGYFDELSCSDESNYPDANIIYLEEGEALINVGVYKNKSATFSVEYMGESITNVEYEQNCLENLIIGCEVAEDHDFFQLEHFSYIALTFSSGKTINKVLGYDVFYYDAPLKVGENTGYMEILNHKEPITFTAYPVSKFIKSMEITNVEKITEFKVDYRGEIQKTGLVCDETVTVTFTDGSKIEVKPSPDIDVGMDFINGHHYRLKTLFTETENGLVFELGFGKHLFSEGTPILYTAPCKETPISFSENLKVLSSAILREYLWVFADIDLGSIPELDLKELCYAHMNSMAHIKEFFNYYF